MHLVADADKHGSLLNLKELLHCKDLFYILAYRDLRVRYAQTFLVILIAFIYYSIEKMDASNILYLLVVGRCFLLRH